VGILRAVMKKEERENVMDTKCCLWSDGYNMREQDAVTRGTRRGWGCNFGVYR